MELSTLFSTPKRYDEAIILGRFQPFTLGHLRMYEYAKQHYDTVYVGVSYKNQPEYSVTNPYDTPTRMHWAKKATNAPVFRVHGLFHEKVFEAVGRPLAMVVGADREAACKRMYEDNNELEYLIVPRSDEDISATKVRTALLSNDREGFEQRMPKALWEDFQKMRKIILRYETTDDTI